MAEKPCCQASALRKVKQISIDGTKVGISQFDNIFEVISKMSLQNNNQIKNELLRQVKIYNYIPSSAEKSYKEAIFREYKRYLNSGGHNHGRKA